MLQLINLAICISFYAKELLSLIRFPVINKEGISREILPCPKLPKGEIPFLDIINVIITRQDIVPSSYDNTNKKLHVSRIYIFIEYIFF